MKTMICLILDRSGSMRGREADVVGGVNSFIEDQKKVDGEAMIAMVRFDTVAIERFRPMMDLKDCKPLALDEFQPRGGTPLLDAVGMTVVQLDEDWKREQPDACIVIVATDGEENASREYTNDKVKDLIGTREKSGKWSFIYLGAHVNAFAAAGRTGFSVHNTASNDNNAAGTRAVYMSASSAVSEKRMSQDMLAGKLGVHVNDDGSVNASAAPNVTVTVPTPNPAWLPPAKSPDSWTPPPAA